MKPTRRIAFLSTMASAPWGGSELLWSQAAIQLRALGHEVFANVRAWPTPAGAIAQLRSAGVRVTERGFDHVALSSRMLLRARQECEKMAAVPLLERWLKRARPELVVISNGCFGDDLRLIDACCRSGIPYALIAHANAECMWPDDTPASALLAAYRGARRAFFVARANKELLETQLGCTLPNAEHVWNPFTARREISAWPDESSGIRLACVARLHPKSKGQDLLLRVLASERWRSRPVSVSFFGQGDNEASLRRLVQQLGLEDRVHFRGHVGDVAAIWDEHHALVLPSRYEGLPISLVEAMLAGRPAIVTRIGGMPEILADGSTGFVASAPDVEHLAEAMERAWEMRSAWSALGEAASRNLRPLLPQQPGAAFATRLVDLVESPSPRPGPAAGAQTEPVIAGGMGWPTLRSKAKQS